MGMSGERRATDRVVWKNQLRTVSGTFFHYSAPQRFGDLMASGAE